MNINRYLKKQMLEKNTTLFSVMNINDIKQNPSKKSVSKNEVSKIKLLVEKGQFSKIEKIITDALVNDDFCVINSVIKVLGKNYTDSLLLNATRVNAYKMVLYLINNYNPSEKVIHNALEVATISHHMESFDVILNTINFTFNTQLLTDIAQAIFVSDNIYLLKIFLSKESVIKNINISTSLILAASFKALDSLNYLLSFKIALDNSCYTFIKSRFNPQSNKEDRLYRIIKKMALNHIDRSQDHYIGRNVNSNTSTGDDGFIQINPMTYIPSTSNIPF